LTGRTHQIRVHLAHIGHPVAGDPVYGRRGAYIVCAGRDVCPVGSPERECPLAGAPEGQLLHSSELEFTHPSTGERMRFKSKLPGYFPVGGSARAGARAR
jgi:23S rRNA pseudouridine1911/1915/1917 synthase